MEQLLKCLFIACLVGAQAPADVAKAERVLAEKPDDPAANLVVGKHYLATADPEKAIACLAKGSDASLKAVALAESAVEGKKALDYVDIADLWTKAMTKNMPIRQACLDRASYWYAKAWPDLDAVWRQKLHDRLSKLYVPSVPSRSSKLPEGWGGPVDLAHKSEVLSLCAHSGGAAARFTPGKNAKNASFLRSPTIGLPKGKMLEFSAWVLSDGTESLEDGIRFNISSGDGKAILSKVLGIATDTPIWVRLSVTSELPDAALRANIEVVVFSSKGSVWVDDLSIKVDGKDILPNGGFEK